MDAPAEGSPGHQHCLDAVSHVEVEMLHPKLCAMKDKEISILLLVATMEILSMRAPDLELKQDQTELLAQRFYNQMNDLGRNTEEPLFVKRFYLLEIMAESRFMTTTIDFMDGNLTCQTLIQVFSKCLW
jgi:hypothetical protein